MWWEEHGARVNVHGMAGPLKWPLRCPGKLCFEESIVYDRCGVPGHVRQLSPLEVWWCQGRTTEDWKRMLEECGSEEKAKAEGCRATGVQTAQTLLVAATSLYRGGLSEDGEKAGAVKDFQDESLAKLLLWLRRWKQGDFGKDRGSNERRAGGEAMWIEAMEEWEYYVMVKIYAGGRRKRASADEERGNSLVSHGEGALLPFDGGVSVRVEEWLEANMQGDKADSTSRAYHSSWQKWVAWARRQRWDSEYLDPKQAKIENENRLLAFLGYNGMAWVVAGNHATNLGFDQGLPQKSWSGRSYRGNVPNLAVGELPRQANFEETSEAGSHTWDA